MKLHPIARRILEGGPVCMGEIREHGARRIIAEDDHWLRAGPHDPKECTSTKPKDCSHGNGSNRWFADVLLQQAREECTCGQHRGHEGGPS